MKLAVFEDFHSSSAFRSSGASMTDDLRAVVEHSLGPTGSCSSVPVPWTTPMRSST